MGTFWWIQAVIVRDPGIMSAAFELKAPGQTITPEVYLVVASTVDTVDAFNIGIGTMLLSLRNLELHQSFYRFRFAFSIFVHEARNTS